MSLTRPILPRGPRGRERESVLRRTREEVRARSAGRCQWPGCSRQGTDLAHGWGRRHIIGQPLCDHPALCWWACREHHDLYDGRVPATPADLDAEEALQWDMWTRAVADLGVDGSAWLPVAHGITYEGRYAQPIDAVRWLERRLKETGVIRAGRWAE